MHLAECRYAFLLWPSTVILIESKAIYLLHNRNKWHSLKPLNCDQHHSQICKIIYSFPLYRCKSQIDWQFYCKMPSLDATCSSEILLPFVHSVDKKQLLAFMLVLNSLSFLCSIFIDFCISRDTWHFVLWAWENLKHPYMLNQVYFMKCASNIYIQMKILCDHIKLK